MNWLTVAWSMCAGVCVMLGLLHFLLWIRSRRFKFLLSTLMAFSAAACAMLELSMLQSSSIPFYQRLLQYQNLFVYSLLISMVWLVFLQLNTARRWIAYLITAMWSIGLVVNFVTPGSLVYESVNELKQQTVFWGETFTVASGTGNPWVWLVNVATILILIYVADASVQAWRRGKKQSAGVIGGGIVVFLLFGLVHSVLVDSGTLDSPYMVSFAYLAIVMAMSYELVSDAVRAPQLAQKIQANEQRWSDLLENVQLAVIAINPKGLISYTNPFFEKLTGYSINSLQGKRLMTLLPKNEHEEFAKRMDRAKKAGPRPHSQWSIVCATGEERQLVWSPVRQTDNNGEYAGILSIGTDITDQIAAQQDLQRSQKELERLTRASMLGELASTLAHELNQPLAAILSNSQAGLRFMASEEFDVNELRDIFNDIIRDNKRASNVIQTMRNMLIKEEIKKEKISIKQTINEVTTILKSELEDQKIKLNLQIPTDKNYLLGVRVEIQQVLINLILNAAHAMEKTQVESREILVKVDIEDNEFKATVEDNGRGIAKDDLPHLFDAFFTRENGGMGMGLAISRRIVDAHGGKIWAENRNPNGARFCVVLPV